jgi:hypothetical protein
MTLTVIVDPTRFALTTTPSILGSGSEETTPVSDAVGD